MYLMYTGVTASQPAREQQAAFEYLKEALTCEPILKRPDFSKPFIVQTDWCKHSVAAILAQPGDPGLVPGRPPAEHVVCYASRVLKGPELNLSAPHGECLAVIYALTVFRPYIYGREFTIVSDAAALKWLLTTTNLTGKLERWSLILQDYWVKEIQYRPGPTHHQNVDGLSRLPVAASDPPALPAADGLHAWDSRRLGTAASPTQRGTPADAECSSSPPTHSNFLCYETMIMVAEGSPAPAPAHRRLSMASAMPMPPSATGQLSRLQQVPQWWCISCRRTAGLAGMLWDPCWWRASTAMTRHAS